MEHYLIKLLIIIIALFVTGEFFNKMDDIFDKNILQLLSASFYILFIIVWLLLIVYGIFLMIK